MIQPSHLYVIQREDGLVKIGVAKDPKSRARQLRKRYEMQMDLVKTFPIWKAYDVEAEAHYRLIDRQAFGEWFKVPASVAVETIEEILALPLLFPCMGRERVKKFSRKTGRITVEVALDPDVYEKLARVATLRRRPAPGLLVPVIERAVKDWFALAEVHIALPAPPLKRPTLTSEKMDEYRMVLENTSPEERDEWAVLDYEKSTIGAPSESVLRKMLPPEERERSGKSR